MERKSLWRTFKRIRFVSGQDWHFDMESVQRESTTVNICWPLDTLIMASHDSFSGRRHSCTSATCLSQRRRFCHSVCSFLSKITLKIGRLEFEAQTPVHFWFWGCNCLTVTYRIMGWMKNSDILDTVLACWIKFALCKCEIVFTFPECLKHQTTNYYFMLTIIVFAFPSI